MTYQNRTNYTLKELLDEGFFKNGCGEMISVYGHNGVLRAKQIAEDKYTVEVLREDNPHVRDIGDLID